MRGAGRFVGRAKRPCREAAAAAGPAASSARHRSAASGRRARRTGPDLPSAQASRRAAATSGSALSPSSAGKHCQTANAVQGVSTSERHPRPLASAHTAFAAVCLGFGLVHWDSAKEWWHNFNEKPNRKPGRSRGSLSPSLGFT